MNETCQRLYSRITGGKEILTIEYNSNIFGSQYLKVMTETTQLRSIF